MTYSGSKKENSAESVNWPFIVKALWPRHFSRLKFRGAPRTRFAAAQRVPPGCSAPLCTAVSSGRSWNLKQSLRAGIGSVLRAALPEKQPVWKSAWEHPEVIGGAENPSPLHLTCGYLRHFSRRLCSATTQRSAWSRQCDRDRCARSDSVRVCCTAAPIRKETLQEGESLRSKCHAPSWSRNISIHPRSQTTANWTLIQVTEGDLRPPRCFRGRVCGLEVERRGGIAPRAVGGGHFPASSFFPLAYNERVLTNMSALLGMNHEVCSSTWTQLLKEDLEFSCSTSAGNGVETSAQILQEVYCCTVSGCIDLGAARCLEETLKL